MKAVVTWVFALLLTLSAGSVHSNELDTENPFRMLEQIAERITTRIASERTRIESNPQYLRTIMEEELLPYSDYQFAARSVMARNWQRLNEAQQTEFVEVFREYLITTYARVFTQFDESKHKLNFARGGDYENQRRVVVRAQLIEEGGRPPIRLDFHLQRRNPTAPWMAFDLVAEGVSMLNTQQAEMQSSLRQNGIDGTIQLLRDRANVEIRLDEDLDVSDFTN
ncbi:MlaC/ttg2D family ABC transporter substrate-binding protein [Aliidiomarina halalkaliphila]|nr:ABC transporter substrate-binding protein [Aliidiomarina halalkaliphila]